MSCRFNSDAATPSTAATLRKSVSVCSGNGVSILPVHLPPGFDRPDRCIAALPTPGFRHISELVPAVWRRRIRG